MFIFLLNILWELIDHDNNNNNSNVSEVLQGIGFPYIHSFCKFIDELAIQKKGTKSAEISLLINEKQNLLISLERIFYYSSNTLLSRF